MFCICDEHIQVASLAIRYMIACSVVAVPATCMCGCVGGESISTSLTLEWCHPLHL